QPWQTKFPFIYPVALAQIWRIFPSFPENTPALVLFAWIWLPAYIVLAGFTFAALGLSNRIALALCGFLALNPTVVLFGISLMPELMFSCLLMASLLLLGRGWRMSLLAGAIGGVAYLTRSAALPLLLSGPIFLLCRQKRREAVFFAAGMLPAVIAWTVWVRTHLPSSSDPIFRFYTDYFGYYLDNVSLRDIPLFVVHNAACLLGSIGDLFILNPTDSFWSNAALRFIGVIAIAGCFRRTQFHFFAAAYGAVLLIWHYTPTERILIPLFPVLLAGFVFKLKRLGQRINLRAQPFAIAVLLCLAMYASGRGTGTYLITHLRDARRNLEVNRRLYAWIGSNLPLGAQFVSADDTLIYLYTGRHAISYQFPPKLFYRRDEARERHFFASVPAFARAHDIQYAVAGASRTIADLPPADKAAAERFLRGSASMAGLYADGAARIYRIANPDSGNQPLTTSEPNNTLAGNVIITK
ncbi:MAG: hypothetical protein M3Z85_06950, partial [Acidobacteriota bacterium]|nr:hypothetical protein [Acidobacteriota bacterium]